jgi:hypothetical protein
VAHDTRDEVIDYVRHWSGRTELPAKQLVKWMGMGMSKYHDWKKRYGQVHEHNGLVPRDHWLEAWERGAIVALQLGTSAGRLPPLDLHAAGRRSRTSWKAAKARDFSSL